MQRVVGILAPLLCSDPNGKTAATTGMQIQHETPQLLKVRSSKF
jgi:hypothetical protein